MRSFSLSIIHTYGIFIFSGIGAGLFPQFSVLSNFIPAVPVVTATTTSVVIPRGGDDSPDSKNQQEGATRRSRGDDGHIALRNKKQKKKSRAKGLHLVKPEKKSKLKAKRESKNEGQTENDDTKFCTEYCTLYNSAIGRCPYPHAISASCVQDCIDASFSKNGNTQDFALKDTVQCRMNHAKMAIKEGPLTNSNHCLHASLEGPERCFPDATAQTREATLAAGKAYLYRPSASFQVAGDDMSKVVQIYFAAVTYLIALRGRLYVAYPDYNKEEEDQEDMGEQEVDCESTMVKKFRTIDGTCNNLDHPMMGSVDMPFSRNLKPSEPHKDGEVDVAIVASAMKRPYGEPPSDTLQNFNQLASAWIQFMTHDWFQHEIDGRKQPKYFRGPLRNRVTHWWDASQIYGSSKEEESRVRLKNGKLHLDENNELDYNDFGVPLTGFNENFWVGLHVFHTIFSREHNYIVDSLSAAYPEMSDDEKYETARLCVSAILAKIHLLEWTPALLDNTISTLSLNVTWYGLKNAVSGLFSGVPLGQVEGIINALNVPAVLTNEFDSRLTIQNTPFSITEEFVAVYRMHPFLPDELDIDGRKLSLHEFTFKDARTLTVKKEATEVLLNALSKAPARQLSLVNYPYTLYDLHVPGRGKLNLAEIDLKRDRERNIPRYNDARRQLLLEPYASLDDLTDNEEDLKILKSIYTDIEQVDFMVGCLADKERPEGFAFGVVPYHIFVVMASRRIFSDRFFMEGLNVENYSPWGLNYVMNESFQSILVRHFPALDGVVPQNPFQNGWNYQ